MRKRKEETMFKGYNLHFNGTQKQSLNSWYLDFEIVPHTCDFSGLEGVPRHTDTTAPLILL